MPDPPVTITYLPPLDAQPAPVQKTFSGANRGVPFLSSCGEYEHLELVAEGGMGVVYKAWHPRLKRVAALKLIRAGQVADPAELARFRLEAEAGAALDHVNIVPVYGAGEVDGQPFLAMKWVEGGSLSARLGQFQKQPGEAARLVAKVARAVHYAHQRGILHRDIKPSNILLDLAGEPLVTDFGLAKRLDVDAGLTATGAVAGTPEYMAPEQALGQKSLTVAVDVHALGAVLYALLVGRPPFQGTHFVEVLERVVGSSPIPPRAINPEVEADLEAICLKCLEKEPSQRYSSAEALADDLDRYCQGEAVEASIPGIGDWLRQVMRTRPRSDQDNYRSWVLACYGGVTLLMHSAILVLVQAGGTVPWAWAILLTGWSSVCLVLVQRLRRFRWLSGAERRSLMVSLGVQLASLNLALALVPWDAEAPAREVLRLYPALACVGGIALFVHGAMDWSRLYLLGAGVTILAPFMARWPDASPLLYGATVSLCMWYSAYSLTTFGGEKNDKAAKRKRQKIS